MAFPKKRGWQAVRLDKSISIQRSTVSGDDRSQAWSNVAVGVWAYVEERRGRDLLLASTELFRADALFVIRYREDFREGDRVVYQSRIYSVIAPPREMVEVGRRVATELIGKYTNRRVS